MKVVESGDGYKVATGIFSTIAIIALIGLVFVLVRYQQLKSKSNERRPELIGSGSHFRSGGVEIESH